ncbi:UNVERIFIED_CONTAM: hypothetical protein HDU68_003917 [Siphonaria sp. JEL0065]|nr:hypothetical protein HDU68_003917 [Siphonaria sp. JEL0065]
MLDDFIKQASADRINSKYPEAMDDNVDGVSDSVVHDTRSDIGTAATTAHRKMSGSTARLDVVPERRNEELEGPTKTADESLMKIYSNYPGNSSRFGDRSGLARQTSGGFGVSNHEPPNMDNRVQDWIAGNSLRNSTNIEDGSDQALEAVSRRLDAMGLPSLNASLFSANTSSSSLPTTVIAQKHHLSRIFNTLLDELSRKTEDTQKLSDRVSEGLEARRRLEDQLHQYEDALKRGESKDWRIIQELQDSLTNASSQIAVLRSDLVAAKHDIEDSKIIQAQLKKRSSELELEKIQAVSELESFKQKAEKTRRQNEQTFTRIAETVNRYKTDVSKSGIDRLTLEVIEGYEAKLADVKKELADLRNFKFANLGGTTQHTGTSANSFSRGTRLVDFDQEIQSLESSGFPNTRHFIRQDANGESYAVSLDSNKVIHAQKLLEEQIRDLEDRLEISQKHLTEATQQSELLRLQLLESKRPGWVEQARSDIDAMNLDECRTILKSVCIHLAITDVPSLLPGLAAIDTTLRLLPQLQSFVSAIDSLVHDHYTHLFTTATTNKTQETFSKKVTKLSELVSVVNMWAEASHQVEELRDFRKTIHRALGVRESSGSLAGCLEIVGRLKERSGVVGPLFDGHGREGGGNDGGDSVKRFVGELYQLFGVKEGAGSLQVLFDVCRGLKMAVEVNGGREGEGLGKEESEKLKELERFAQSVHRELGVRFTRGNTDVCLERLEELVQKSDSGPGGIIDAFLDSAHKVLGVNRKSGSLDDCLAVIRILVEKGRNSPQVQKQNYELYSRIVEHFMELFEIKSVDEVNSAVNELYVMFSERNASIARLRNSIRNTSSVNVPLDTPARVLAEAADLIDATAAQGFRQSLRASTSGRDAQSKESQPQQQQQNYTHHQNPDGSFDPFNDDLLQAINSATHQQNDISVHNPIPLDWAEDNAQFQQQQENVNQSRSRGSVGPTAPNRSWQEISSSIRNLTSGLGGVVE